MCVLISIDFLLSFINLNFICFFFVKFGNVSRRKKNNVAGKWMRRRAWKKIPKEWKNVFLRWLICQTDTQQTNHTHRQHMAADSHTLTIPFHSIPHAQVDSLRQRENKISYCLWHKREWVAAACEFECVYLTKSCRTNFYFSFAIAPSTKFYGDRHSNRSTCIFLVILFFPCAACSLFNVNGCVHFQFQSLEIFLDFFLFFVFHFVYREQYPLWSSKAVIRFR